MKRNRGDADDARRTANRYLKRIRYGNRTPLLVDEAPAHISDTQDQLDDADWMFEVVFDYGEHDLPTDARRRTTRGAMGPWTAPGPVLLLPRRLRGAHLLASASAC